MQAPLEFGWFLPTWGDTTCYGDRGKFIPPLWSAPLRVDSLS